MIAVGERPTWAVVIPAFNEAARIGDALLSLRQQTEPADEVIVCDDGSTDDLPQALSAFLGEFDLVRQDNRGLPAARNTGAANVQSDWILFLDADDHLAPNFLQRLRDISQISPDIGLIGTEAEGYNEVDRRVLYRHYRDREVFPDSQQREAILTRNFLLTPSVRRDLWIKAGRFDESFQSCEDWDCWLRMILRGTRAALVEDAILYRRHHGQNMSANRQKMAFWSSMVIRRALIEESLSDHERKIALETLDSKLRRLKALETGSALRDLVRTDGFRSRFFARWTLLRLAASKRVSLRQRIVVSVAMLIPFPSHLFPRRWR